MISKLPPKRKNQYRVLYWREAFYYVTPLNLQRKFDFQMGVHWWSGILNPQFMRTPASLLGGVTYPQPQVIPFIAPEQRTNFAMSIISNCFASSQRQTYINRLSSYVGKNRVHQYGKCGNLQLPPPPIKNAAKVIATHKFYLSFENTIQDGYCTEKLLQVLSMPVVPVYYGSPSLPNITIIPSFIKVSDFSHPKYLAEYMLYLDSNHEAYNQYHAWRTNSKLFHPEYLEMLAIKSPGVYEMWPLRRIFKNYYPRAAACCRLCDENYLKYASDSRTHYTPAPLRKPRIEQNFFQGDFFSDPKSKN